MCLWEPSRHACVPRQLAAVLGVSLDEASSYFNEFLDPGWRERGVTALEVRALCERQGRCFYFLSGHRMLDVYEPPAKRRALRGVAMTSWEGHSYMYTNARTVCQRHVSVGESVQARMAGEAH